MSKEKIRKVVTNNQKKLFTIVVMLLTILVIVSISVYASRSDNYIVEIKDNGEKNIARNEDYNESMPKAYDSSITKKIIEDKADSLTYEVQIKSLAQTKPNAQVAIVVDSSMSMKNNDTANTNYNLIEKVKMLVTQLRENSQDTRISIASNNKLEVGMGQSSLNRYLTDIDNIEFTYGEELPTAIDYASGSFINNNEQKYLIVFSDATDKAKDKLEGLVQNNGIEVISVLSDITNNEYNSSTNMGKTYMLSDVTDFSNIIHRINNSIANVTITDIFSNEVNEYFDFEEVSKTTGLETEKTANGYILKCNQIKPNETMTYTFALKLKENTNIEVAKTYKELKTSDNLKVEYIDVDEQSHTYEMENSPTFVICNKYSLTIKAVSEKSTDLPITNMDVKVIGTTVIGQDENGNDIVETIYNETLKTDSNGNIKIDNLKTLGDIKFEIKPIVNQFGYVETSATTVIIHNDPTGVGAIWAESDIIKPEVDIIERNVTVLLPILVQTYTMEVETIDLADSNIKLGNIEYRLIQPKLNSKYEMEALYETSGTDGKLTFKPAVMTKDGSYQYVLTQMTEQEGYDGMGVVIIIVTFENGRVTKIEHKYNEDVETELINSMATKVIVGNSPLKEDAFNLNINLSDEYTEEKLFGAIYDILVTRTTTAGDQVQTLLSSYITDDNGQINISIPGTGYVNLKITEVSPRAGYVADTTLKDITFLRKNGTVQYISSKTPADLEAIADSDNNTIKVNLKSKLASEQNRLQVHLIDENEQDVNIGRVALAINKVGETNKIYGETNREGIANFTLPNESAGSYQYEISLVQGVPSGYVAPTIPQLGVVTLQYNANGHIVLVSKVSQTVPTLNVSFEQELKEEIIYDTAKVELSLDVDPTYSYNFKIALLDESTNKGLANGKYSILMEADGEEVKYLSGKLTNASGNYTTRIVGEGQNITIKVTQTATEKGYIKTPTTQVIELEKTSNGYNIVNSGPNVYDPANNQYIGTEKLENDIIYHDINTTKTGANTILNLYVNKMDTNDFLIEGIKVKLSSDTLLREDGKKLDDPHDVLNENGIVVGQETYYTTDQNGYFEKLAIKVKGNELSNGERVDYLYVSELDDQRK